MRRITANIAALGLLTALLLARSKSVSADSPRPADAPGVSSSAMPKEDEKAIRRTIMGFEEAWNAHDMKALEKLFTPDADWINVVGMHWKGRDAIVKAHAAFHATMFKDHRLKTDSIELRPLGSEYALAVVTTTNDAFTTPAGERMPKAQNIQTYVLAKGANGWEVVHGHNVVVNAEAVKHDPVNAPRQ